MTNKIPLIPADASVQVSEALSTRGDSRLPHVSRLDFLGRLLRAESLHAEIGRLDRWQREKAKTTGYYTRCMMEVTRRSPLVERALGLLRPDWASAWHELAKLIYGITDNDRRFPHIMTALYACDDAFRAGNWRTFCESAEKVKSLVKALR